MHALMWYVQVSYRCLTCMLLCDMCRCFAGVSQGLTCAGLCGMRWPLRCLTGACILSRVVVYALFCMGYLTCPAKCAKGQASSVKRLES